MDEEAVGVGGGTLECMLLYSVFEERAVRHMNKHPAFFWTCWLADGALLIVCACQRMMSACLTGLSSPSHLRAPTRRLGFSSNTERVIAAKIHHEAFIWATECARAPDHTLLSIKLYKVLASPQRANPSTIIDRV